MKKLLGRESKGIAAWLIAIIAIGGLTTTAVAEEAEWFSAVSSQDATVVYADEEQAPAESTKLIPWMTIGLSLDVVSDYIWRGIDFSGPTHEEGDDLNYQLGVDVSFDLAMLTDIDALGTIGANVWFEWYTLQERLNPGDGNNLQEVDYTVYYSPNLAAMGLDIGLDVTVGWIAYQFPRTKGDDPQWTHEVFIELAWDDAMIFGESLLNPTLTWYRDLDDVQASVFLFGISHDFALADYGCEDMVVLKDTTVTPSATLMIDHRYYDKAGVGGSGSYGTRMGYIEYGVSASVDLSSVLGIPAQYGAFGIGGFVNYVQPFHDEDPAINDQLYGGLNLSWEF